MEETLTISIIFWNTSVITLILVVETRVFSSALNMFLGKTPAWNLSNSHNHIKEELMS